MGLEDEDDAFQEFNAVQDAFFKQALQYALMIDDEIMFQAEQFETQKTLKLESSTGGSFSKNPTSQYASLKTNLAKQYYYGDTRVSVAKLNIPASLMAILKISHENPKLALVEIDNLILNRRVDEQNMTLLEQKTAIAVQNRTLWEQSTAISAQNTAISAQNTAIIELNTQMQNLQAMVAALAVAPKNEPMTGSAASSSAGALIATTEPKAPAYHAVSTENRSLLFSAPAPSLRASLRARQSI